MPNNCDNDLKISGSPNRIQEFRDFAKNRNADAPEGEDLIDINNFVPYPEELRDKDSEGYDWCWNNWGTDRGIYDCMVTKEGPRSILYRFSTATSPALPVILKMSELFPDLSFILRYYECGRGFKGTYKCKSGQILENVEHSYHGIRGG